MACALLIALCLSASGADDAAARGRTHVYLLRGIFNVSVGLDALAVKLARRGLATQVYGHGEAYAVAAQAIADYRSGRALSIILIGHSLGAGASVVVAERLNEAGVPVRLLVALDPVATLAVPSNVRRAVDFYLSGSGRPLTASAGFRGSLRNVDLQNVPGADHMTIQSMDSMHRRVMNEIGG